MTNRTNREVLIHALQNFEAECDEDYVTDYLACPYVSLEDCVNYQEGADYNSSAWNDNCSYCKRMWLLKE